VICIIYTCLVTKHYLCTFTETYFFYCFHCKHSSYFKSIAWSVVDLIIFMISYIKLLIYTSHLLCPPNEVWETYCVCSVSSYYYFYYYYSSSSFFLPPKVYPTHFSATTERKSMKLHRNVKHYA
jgi:hypothetical protein